MTNSIVNSVFIHQLFKSLYTLCPPQGNGTECSVDKVFLLLMSFFHVFLMAGDETVDSAIKQLRI